MDRSEERRVGKECRCIFPIHLVEHHNYLIEIIINGTQWMHGMLDVLTKDNDNVRRCWQGFKIG